MNYAKKVKVLPVGNKLQPHTLAETVPGEMNAEEFGALCASIKADGLCNPIVLFEGKILDGRARYAALTKLKMQIESIEFEGDTAKAIAYVMDNNLHRRQLNAMQKALVGARMCTRPDNPLSQREAAELVGASPTTINLCVRLLNSKNAPLIKRTEHGETTRAEVDEILFDSTAARAQAPTRAPAPAIDGDDDLVGNDPKSSNVVPIKPSSSGGSGFVGKRPQHPEKRPRETPASICVQVFKDMSDEDKKAFVDMAWQWLEPFVVAHTKSKKRAA